jgi:carbamoyltransferase
MLQNHKVIKEIAKLIPAVVHTDLTSRYQSVKKKTNKKYYLLIKEFYKLTGIPLVLNTSFNIGGDPIVCTPKQAVKTFYSSAIDCLAIGDYWITKK